MTGDLPEGLSASLEDYLEVIYHLERSNRVARAKDIADQMSVQRASVTGALKALAGRGLINYSPYSYITLTSAGRTVAQDIIRRHETLKEFFMRGSAAGLRKRPRPMPAGLNTRSTPWRSIAWFVFSNSSRCAPARSGLVQRLCSILSAGFSDLQL